MLKEGVTMDKYTTQWVVLGRNGPYPMPGGACSGYLLNTGGTLVLFDVGAGTFGRLISCVDPLALKGVFISHWHSDHCSDLLVFEYYLQSLLAEGKKAVLPLYGPVDETSPVYQHISRSPFFHFTPVAKGDGVKVGEVTVQAGPICHPARGVSYRVGDWAYTGDTNITPGLKSFVSGARVLLACGCNLHENWQENSPHLSGVKAAQLAKDAGVGRLYLTHLKPTVDIQQLTNEAKAVFVNTFIIEEKKYTL